MFCRALKATFSSAPVKRPQIGATVEAFPVNLSIPDTKKILRLSNHHPAPRSRQPLPAISCPDTRAASPAPKLVTLPSSLSSPVESCSILSRHERALQLSPNRMLARDFIHDSLYNEDYGYFSKRAVIFSPPTDIDFNSIRSTLEFDQYVQRIYSEYDDVQEEEALQVWHTPTELFKPWYGYALGNYILQTHKRLSRTDEPLIIYEMGAGNGTLMCNILTFIRQQDPQVYSRMQYNIIEISKQLTERQEWNNLSRLNREAQQFGNQVSIINKSIFDWQATDSRPCFFIALEVIDNFAHDAIRYNLSAEEFPIGQPLQTQVSIDPETQTMEEEYEPINDPLIQRYLDYRQQAGYQSPVEKVNHSIKTRLRQLLPLAPNVSDPEFLPTMQMYFMELLRDKFPNHRLILSDFDSLPTEIRGLDAPVVQTRQRLCMIPCSTYLVTRGWFDIFFPTNFELMADIYALINHRRNNNNLGRPQSDIRVAGHGEFLAQFVPDLARIRTKNGETPMLSHYSNVKFLLSC